MKKLLLIGYALFFSFASQVKGQDVAVSDSVSIADNDTIKPFKSALDGDDESNSTVEKGVSALQYSLLHRYKVKGEPFVKGGFFRHAYIGAYSGMEQLSPRGDIKYSAGHHSGFLIGKEINSLNEFRLSAFLGNYNRQIDNQTLNYYGLSIDHLFSITNLVGGYHPGRFFNVSTVVGLAARYSSFNSESKFVPELYGGLQFKYNVNQRMSFFIEPRFSLLGDGIDHSENSNFRKYDVGYALLFGLNYRFTPIKLKSELRDIIDEGILDNTFISYALGGQFQSSDKVSDLGAANTMGHSYMLSLGKWLTSSFGLRFSLFQSGDFWHYYQASGQSVNPETKTGESVADDATEEEVPEEDANPVEKASSRYEMTSYHGFRVEGMFNWTNFFFKYNENRRISSSILLGLEVGQLEKLNGDGLIRTKYNGLTTGLQVKYNLSGNVAFFVEPRYTSARYSIPYKDYFGTTIIRKFQDNIYSLNFGIELSRPSKNRMLELSLNEGYDKYWFASGNIGFGVPVQKIKYELKKYIDYRAGISLGRTFSYSSGARVNFDASRVSEDIKTGYRQYNLLSAGIDYMLQLSNIYAGFDPDRRMNINLFFGPVMTMRKAAKENSKLIYPNGNYEEYTRTEAGEDKNFFGFHLSFQSSYAINRNVELFLEPHINLYGKDFLDQQGATGNDKIISVQIGASYKLFR